VKYYPLLSVAKETDTIVWGGGVIPGLNLGPRYWIQDELNTQENRKCPVSDADSCNNGTRTHRIGICSPINWAYGKAVIFF
jgi:hypothetical protein